MGRFIPRNYSSFGYHKHVNSTHVKELHVSTVQFSNGEYETVIFNRSHRRLYVHEYMGEGVRTPGRFVQVGGMQYRHFTRKEALRAHSEFVTLLNSYA